MKGDAGSHCLPFICWIGFLFFMLKNTFLSVAALPQQRDVSFVRQHFVVHANHITGVHVHVRRQELSFEAAVPALVDVRRHSAQITRRRRRPLRTDISPRGPGRSAVQLRSSRNRSTFAAGRERR